MLLGDYLIKFQMGNKPRTTISDAQLKAELFKMFESGNTSNTNIYEQLRTKYKLMKQRHVKFFHQTYSEWAGLKEKATAEQIHANAIEQLKTAVMSKQERLELLTKIAKGEFENEVRKPTWNHIEKKFQIVTVKEKPDHNGIIKAISEMNKMEGDYAPTKMEHSGEMSINFVEEKTYETKSKTD